ncbi:MAG: AAA family ATPase [Cyclobacteriaceae bacterium]|nr:AAA family ATPase [Cyclobacteriaceae bacterium]
MQTNNLLTGSAGDSPFRLDNTANKTSLSDLFFEKHGSYLNKFTLFTAHFNSIPNFIQEIEIDCERATRWFSGNYKSEIKDLYYEKGYSRKRKEMLLENVFYFLYEDLIINFDVACSVVYFLFRKTEPSKVEAISSAIRKFRERKQRKKPEISLLINGRNGIKTNSMDITRPKLSIDDNYNDDFKEIHHTILKRLSRKNDKGLVLLHGKPGTGKTSYIRYLIASLKKDVIFLPPNMASAITNPDLISILVDNPNSVFVIEDAENIIIDREKNENSPVSALLNIADGLLADCLNIQVICSFNTDISKIDSALMRKGRLIAKYEFKELEIEKAQQLSNKLGFNTHIHEPMTLASIYNQEEKNFQQNEKRKPVGFHVNSLIEN